MPVTLPRASWTHGFIDRHAIVYVQFSDFRRIETQESFGIRDDGPSLDRACAANVENYSLQQNAGSIMGFSMLKRLISKRARFCAGLVVGAIRHKPRHTEKR